MAIRSFAVIMLAYSAMAYAEPPAAAPSAAAPEPSLESALAAAQSALDACRVRGFAVSVSVVDAAGVLKTLLAADGASARGVQSSTNKAVTALTFKSSTSDLNQRILTDKGLAEAVAANPNYNTHPGGLLIMNESRIVGAIGVGGAQPSEIDEACAATGLERFRTKTRRTAR
jgi:uncharacterized protein GlcG (DUF336 family)